MTTGPIGTGSTLARLLIKPAITSPKRRKDRPVKRRVPPRPAQRRVGY